MYLDANQWNVGKGMCASMPSPTLPTHSYAHVFSSLLAEHRGSVDCGEWNPKMEESWVPTWLYVDLH